MFSIPSCVSPWHSRRPLCPLLRHRKILWDSFLSSTLKSRWRNQPKKCFVFKTFHLVLRWLSLLARPAKKKHQFRLRRFLEEGRTKARRASPASSPLHVLIPDDAIGGMETLFADPSLGQAMTYSITAPGFRDQHVLLTYVHCTCPLVSALDQLQCHAAVTGCRGVVESHKDGTPHLHVYVQKTKSLLSWSQVTIKYSGMSWRHHARVLFDKLAPLPRKIGSKKCQIDTFLGQWVKSDTLFCSKTSKCQKKRHFSLSSFNTFTDIL